MYHSIAQPRFSINQIHQYVRYVNTIQCTQIEWTEYIFNSIKLIKCYEPIGIHTTFFVDNSYVVITTVTATHNNGGDNKSPVHGTHHIMIIMIDCEYLCQYNTWTENK